MHSEIRKFVAVNHCFMEVLADAKAGDTEPTSCFIEARNALLRIINSLRRDVPNIDTDDSLDSFANAQSLMAEALQQVRYSENDLGLAYRACLVFAFIELPSEDVVWTTALIRPLDRSEGTRDLAAALRQLREEMRSHREVYLSCLPEEGVASYKLGMTKVVVALIFALHDAIYATRPRKRKPKRKK